MGERLMDDNIETFPYGFCDNCLILSPVRAMDFIGVNECRICGQVISQKRSRVVWLSREEAKVRGLRLYRKKRTKGDKHE